MGAGGREIWSRRYAQSFDRGRMSNLHLGGIVGDAGG